MAASAGWVRRLLRVLTYLAVFIPACGATGWAGRCDGSEVGGIVLAVQAVGWTQPRVSFLQAGTRLTDKPPTGWSHLVVKAIPRLASGDQGSLPSAAAKMATLFRTFIVADVRPVDADERDFV